MFINSRLCTRALNDRAQNSFFFFGKSIYYFLLDVIVNICLILLMLYVEYISPCVNAVQNVFELHEEITFVRAVILFNSVETSRLRAINRRNITN